MMGNTVSSTELEVESLLLVDESVDEVELSVEVELSDYFWE